MKFHVFRNLNDREAEDLVPSSFFLFTFFPLESLVWSLDPTRSFLYISFCTYIIWSWSLTRYFFLQSPLSPYLILIITKIHIIIPCHCCNYIITFFHHIYLLMLVLGNATFMKRKMSDQKLCRYLKSALPSVIVSRCNCK